MRLAIVDDDARERAQLRAWLSAELEGLCAELTEFSSGEAFLEAARQQPFSAVFLDIYMSGQNGIAVARALRDFDPACLLVFTTTSTDHALEGFRVRAMQYLVKPYTREEIARLVPELLARLPAPEKYIEIKVTGSTVRLHFSDIVYAEHFSHRIQIHTARAELTTRQSFGSFVEALQGDERFFVCGRGLVINLNHAQDFSDGTFRMDNGSRVPVSRELCKKAQRSFLEFLLQGGCRR